MELISADPRVMHGQAVLAGTRVPVSVILDCLAAGMTAAEIVAEYPVVTAAGVRATAAYGAEASERQHAVAVALASVRAEGLEPSAEDLALFAEVAAGRMTTSKLRSRVLSRYRR
jgi:uncharacterized protein (DUF433 family)